MNVYMVEEQKKQKKNYTGKHSVAMATKIISKLSVNNEAKQTAYTIPHRMPLCMYGMFIFFRIALFG